MQGQRRTGSHGAQLWGLEGGLSLTDPGRGLGVAVTDFMSSKDDPHILSSLGGFSSSTRMGMLITLWSVRGSGKIAISTSTTSCLL